MTAPWKWGQLGTHRGSRTACHTSARGRSTRQPPEGHGCPTEGWSPRPFSPGGRAARCTGAAAATCEAISSASIRRAHRNRASPVPAEGGKRAGLPPPCSPPAPRGRLRRRPRGQRPPHGSLPPPPPPGAVRWRGGPVTSAATWWLLRRPAPAHARGKLPPTPPARHRAGPPRCPAPSPGAAAVVPHCAPRPRAPPAPRRRAARATDAGPPRIPLSRSSAPDTILTGARSRCRHLCPRPRRSGGPHCPRPLLIPAQQPTHSSSRPIPTAATAAGRAGHPVPAEVRAPYRAHADARPLPPRRVGPRGRRSAAPSPVSVSVPVFQQARNRRRRCCRVNESLEVGGGLAPPLAPAAVLRPPLRRAPQRPASQHRASPHRGHRGHRGGRERTRYGGRTGCVWHTHTRVGTRLHTAHTGVLHAWTCTGTLCTWRTRARTWHTWHTGPSVSHRHVDVEGHMQTCTGRWCM